MTWLRIAFILVLGASNNALAEESAPAEQTYDPAKMAEILAIKDSDVVLGSDDAPLTIVEYASLSCSHCAIFHNNILPELKKEYIDTGKLRFINRDFPLNAPALKGAMLVKCAPEGKEETFKKVLYKLQSKWAFSPSYEGAMKKIAKVGGLSEDQFDSCMANKELEESALQVRQEAGDNLPIKGTPAFFLNGKALPIALTIQAFREVLDQANAEE